MKLDKDCKDVMRSLITGKVFLPRYKSLDISKFLDEDKKLDLWFMELAIRNSIRFMSHALGKPTKFNYIEGLMPYCEIRGITFESGQMEEEFLFIYRFVDSIIDDELSPGE